MNLSQVFEAIQILHDPRASRNNRQAAHQFCESLKNDDNSCLGLADQIITPTLPNEVRYFGFQLYEHLITKRWSSLSPDFQRALKDRSLQIIASSTRHMFEEPRFIKEKAVQLVGLIAQREWPLRWPDLLTSLTQLTQTGDTQCELALLALRSIGDGIFDDSSMQDARRNELLVALNTEYASIYSFCYDVLERNFRTWNEASGDGQAARSSQLLITAALLNFETYAPLSSIQAIVDSGVLQALCPLLHTERFRDLSVSVLAAVTAKRSKPPLPHAPLLLFLRGILESCRLPGAGGGGLLAQTDAAFHKRLCAALAEFGCNFFSALQGPGADVAAVRDGYLELMASFAGHGAAPVSAAALPFWRAFLDLHATTLPPGDAVHAALIQAIADKIGRPVRPAEEGGEEGLLGDDFNDWEDYERFWSQVERVRARDN